MRQVLPVVGAAIGAYFGGSTGAQIGWAIGSVVGNAVDPQIIKGPSIGDLAAQTSQEGVPRPIVFALSQPVSGNIVMCTTPRIVTKRQRQGKGGPVTETQSVYRSYAVAICEGPDVQLIRVWSNGKLTYDARPSQPDPGNAKFLQNAVFHNGDWDQMPDSHMQAAFGASSTPAMRGTAYIAWHDIDLTNQGGAVPQYVFQVMRCEGRILTSQPYPQHAVDAVTVIVTPMAGELRTLLKSYALGDAMALSVTPLSGEMKAPLESYTMEPEGLALTLTPMEGTLRSILRGYTIPAEGLQLSVTPLTGSMQRILIQYTNWPAEGLQLSVTPLTGTLA